MERKIIRIKGDFINGESTFFSLLCIMPKPEEILWKSSKNCCLEAAELASESEEFYQELIELTLSGKKPFDHRAGWTLVYLAEKHPARIRPSLRFFASKLDEIDNHSIIASFLRLFDVLIFDLEDFGELLDYCFHTIRMPVKREYVKVIAMNILLKFGKTYPELIPEIIEQIELSKENFEMSHCKRKAANVVKELSKRAEK